jgi:tripartite-type tricarboxylate transporter receptor subunit TctC
MNDRRKVLAVSCKGALTRIGAYESNRHSPVRAFVLSAVVWAALTMTTATAAEYPTKPIRLIVPSAAGGTPDINARLLATELTKQMGRQVVVDNRGGASGIIGYEMIARAEPDGYTLGFAGFPFITNPLMYTKLPYDTARDFQPVVRLFSIANVMTLSPTLPVRSVPELVDYARAQPGKLSYGSAGAGTSQQLSLELFKIMTGTQIVQVSYKGIQQATTDAIAGQVHIVCDNTPSILPHVRAGRLRAIGVTTLKRSPVAPDIPTIAEAGVAGYEMAPSSGYVLPARTPRDIVLRLNAEVNKALASPAVSERLAAAGTVIAGGTPEQFAEHLRRETEKWAKVIKTAGIQSQ